MRPLTVVSFLWVRLCLVSLIIDFPQNIQNNQLRGAKVTSNSLSLLDESTLIKAIETSKPLLQAKLSGQRTQKSVRDGVILVVDVKSNKPFRSFAARVGGQVSFDVDNDRCQMSHDRCSSGL